MPQRLRTDWILFVTVLAMISFGVLMLYSASSVTAKLDPRYGSSWHFVLRQMESAAAAIGIMMAFKRIHYRAFQNPAVAFSAEVS